ncbi:unnamed protein product, partial [Symbiodinium necroappetens]
AVPRILSIHEVPRSTSFAGSVREEPVLASSSASPEEPGTPEMEVRKVSSAKRLGDDIVHLDAEQTDGQSGLEAFSDFPKEFDPLAASRSRNGSERVDLDEIFSAFKTSQDLHMLDRQPIYVEKLAAADIQNSLDQIFPMPPEESPEATKAQADSKIFPGSSQRLVTELPLPEAFSLQPLSEDCNLDAPSITCPVPEKAEGQAPARPRHLEAALPSEVAQGSRRRGRSLDASIPKPGAQALFDTGDPRSAVPFGGLLPSCQEDPAAARRGRSTDDQCRADARRPSWEVDLQPAPFPQELLQLQPMQDIPLFQQVQELQLQPLQNITPPSPPPDVQAKSDSTYQRFMRDADNLLAWDVPGQAYLKYCEANSQHDDLCGQKSGDAYRGMARSLSVGAGFRGVVAGLPTTAEERLDLGMNMLELAVEAGSSKLGDARSDPKLENLRKLRSARFLALMEQVPATGLDALAVAASAGVAAMAAVAGIQPVSLVPTAPVPAAPYVPEPPTTSVFPDPAQATTLVLPMPPSELAAVREVQLPQDSDSDQEEDDEDEEGDGDSEEDGDGEEESEEEGEKPDEEESGASDSEESQANEDEGAASESDAELSWAEALRNFFGW